jgi:hypothetical protein
MAYQIDSCPSPPDELTPTPTRPIAHHHLTLNQRDVFALCDRLKGCADASVAQSHLTSDMRVAQAVIRELWRRWANRGDQVKISV